MGRKKSAMNETKVSRKRQAKKAKELTEAQARIAAAGGTCECTGQCEGDHDCGRCNAPHGVVIVRDPVDGSTWQPMAEIDPEKLDGGRPVKVKLGAVLFRGGEDGEVVTKVFCQRCRLRVDRAVNARRSAASRKRHRRERLAWAELPGVV